MSLHSRRLKALSHLSGAIDFLNIVYGSEEYESVKLLREIRSKVQNEELVPVYRKHQPTMFSPCMIGNPCEICSAHKACLSGEMCKSCRRGKAIDCPKAKPADPAFWIEFEQALTYVRHGLAEFINRKTALRLTFSKIAQLRDASLKITEKLLIEYADGNKRARAAMIFWGNICGDAVEWTPEQMKASREQVQSFR